MTPAIEHLRKSDPRFVEWIDRIGALELPRPPVREPYIALLESIAHQQLAGAAARAIWARVIALFADGVPCSKRLVEMAEADLRAAGLSRSKILAMKDICARVNEGKIPSTALIRQMSDAEIYAQLLEARGVGMWTVDMLMMFALSRPDVNAGDRLRGAEGISGSVSQARAAIAEAALETLGEMATASIRGSALFVADRRGRQKAQEG